LWDTEYGPTTNDEINRDDPGFNTGWRHLKGIVPRDFDFNNLVSFGGAEQYCDPEFVWSETVAPTAITFLDSNALGSQYQNDMFVADLKVGPVDRYFYALSIGTGTIYRIMPN
jgi:glucose/arabinose dehydrogenase